MVDNFENDNDAICYNKLRTISNSRIMLDIIINETITKGYIKINDFDKYDARDYADAYSLTNKGKQYAIQHKLVKM